MRCVAKIQTKCKVSRVCQRANSGAGKFRGCVDCVDGFARHVPRAERGVVAVVLGRAARGAAEPQARVPTRAAHRIAVGELWLSGVWLR